VIVVVHIVGRITARILHSIVLLQEIIIQLTLIAWAGSAGSN
jgi:hypothetical protein